MSRLRKFMATPITVKLGEEEFEIHPLTVKNMDILMATGSEDSKIKSEAFAKLMEITLKKAVPDATVEEIEGFSMKYFQQLTEAIMEANGFSEKANLKRLNLKQEIRKE